MSDLSLDLLWDFLWALPAILRMVLKFGKGRQLVKVAPVVHILEGTDPHTP